MSRTKKQRQGDAGERKSIEEDRWFGGYEIKECKKNNKGYDYKRRRRKLIW